MNKLYNIGDSFSYGNCLCEFEEFATDGEGNIIHLSPGDILAKEEMQELVNRLFLTKHPYYCPHGRPIIVQMSLDELDGRFERH